MRKMYDAIYPINMPKDGDIYASYVDGNWPNFGQLAGLFPGKLHVPICVFADHDATVLDVENGDATPDQAPGWAVRQRNRGQEPTIYANTSTWPLIAWQFQNQHVPLPVWWAANYSNGPVIPSGAIGVQFLNTVPPGYDQSVVYDYWPGVDPKPQPQPQPMEDKEMLIIRSETGAAIIVFQSGNSKAIQDGVSLKGYQDAPLPFAQVTEKEFQTYPAAQTAPVIVLETDQQ